MEPLSQFVQCFLLCGEAWICLGLPCEDELSEAFAGLDAAGTSELDKGSGAAEYVYAVAEERVGEDVSNTGIN